MADSKITALTVRDRATIVPTDTTIVVDISDTSMDASGTDVQVTVAELVAAGGIGSLGLDAAVGARIYA